MKLNRFFVTLWVVPLILLLLIALLLASVTIEKYQIKKKVSIRKKDVMSRNRKGKLA